MHWQRCCKDKRRVSDTGWTLTIINFSVLQLPGAFGSWVSIVSHGGTVGTIPGVDRLSTYAGLTLPYGHVFPQLRSTARNFISEMLEPPGAPVDPEEFINSGSDLVAVLA